MTLPSELHYQLALTLVPNIGDVQARILIQHYGSASAVFQEKASMLEKIEGIGSVRAHSIKGFRDFQLAEDEIKFIEKYKIKTLFLTDKDYPQRLLNCYDSPTLLFYKGKADLNASRIIGIVGTRSNTEYGKNFTEKLVKELSGQDILIISGLAIGIDAIAHKTAVKHGLPTVGVVGHGLDKMYPYENTS
ncbi:MAG TPA: DNA-processing protein DprA, partial [Flavisolibacter sp.]